MRCEVGGLCADNNASRLVLACGARSVFFDVTPGATGSCVAALPLASQWRCHRQGRIHTLPDVRPGLCFFLIFVALAANESALATTAFSLQVHMVVNSRPSPAGGAPSRSVIQTPLTAVVGEQPLGGCALTWSGQGQCRVKLLHWGGAQLQSGGGVRIANESGEKKKKTPCAALLKYPKHQKKRNSAETVIKFGEYQFS